MLQFSLTNYLKYHAPDIIVVLIVFIIAGGVITSNLIILNPFIATVCLFIVFCFMLQLFYNISHKYKRVRYSIQNYNSKKINRHLLSLCLLRTPLNNHKYIRQMILDRIETISHGSKHVFQYSDGDFDYMLYWKKYDAWVIRYTRYDGNDVFSWIPRSDTKKLCFACKTIETSLLCRTCFKFVCNQCLNAPVNYVFGKDWDKPWRIKNTDNPNCPFH